MNEISTPCNIGKVEESELECYPDLRITYEECLTYKNQKRRYINMHTNNWRIKLDQ